MRFDMSREPFEINYRNISTSDNVARYCINRLSELVGLEGAIGTVFNSGGLGGDLDWGIHKSDEYCQEDYGVSEFEGWRFYIGPKESPTYKMVDCYLSQNEFIALLQQAFPSIAIQNIVNESNA